LYRPVSTASIWDDGETTVAVEAASEKELSGMASNLINDLHNRAQTALSNSPFFELHELQVELRDSTLYISGNVSSFYHKQLAQEVVRSVCQGIEVINSIQVEMDE
jgi:hypothetical protein